MKTHKVLFSLIKFTLKNNFLCIKFEFDTFARIDEDYFYEKNYIKLNFLQMNDF